MGGNDKLMGVLAGLERSVDRARGEVDDLARRQDARELIAEAEAHLRGVGASNGPPLAEC